MPRRAVCFAHACVTSILGQNPVSLTCCNKLLCSDSALRYFATTRTPSTAGQRDAQARNVPYLTADIFGRPSLVHPAANPHQHGRDEAVAPGQPEDDADGVHPGRRSRSPRKARPTPSDGDVVNNAQSSSASGPSWSGRRTARLSETTAVTGASSLEESQQGGYKAYPRSEKRSLQLKLSDRQLRAPDQTLQPASPGAGPGKAALHEAESLDRRLTYLLLKADSLQELDRLLSNHTGVPNVIHLAAATRQAVLLGSLPRPHETRKLLDKHLEHWAEATAGLQGEQRPRQLANPQAPANSVASSATGEPGRGQHDATQSVRLLKQENFEAGWRHGQRRQGLADVTSGSATLVDRKLSAEEAAPASSVAAMGGAAAPASTTPASAASNPVAVLPLRELSDMLWAYGKLRCKPPERLWCCTLRPVLLDLGALNQLQEGNVREGGEKPRPASSRRRAAQSAPSPEGDAEGQTGQTLSKLAVALARMREGDVAVWRALARAAAAAAPTMSPRALTSLLWAFGSARMTHGPLLLAAVRTIRLELPQLNGQDLACAMWALARLAPPPLLLPSACDASGSASAAAVARAAAVTATAQDLLYGDLSDAVRRRMQLQGLKPAEITTLLGALDEMAQHQQHHHLHPAHAPPHSSPDMHGKGLPSSALTGAHASTPSRGGRALQASPRLLRVVSQAVRKNLSLLPVGALAEAAAAFQRLGHHDALFFRALAAGMVVRLRHLEPWHLVRAAVALQAVGYSDGAFFAKVLEAAQRDFKSYKTWEVLALVDVCGQLAAPNSAADDSSRPSPDATADGIPRSGPGPVVLDPAVTGAFMHSAVLHAVSSVGATPSSSRVDKRRMGAAESGSRDEAGGVAAPRMAMGPEPLRLRHWNRLLRAAAAAGWQDEGLADRALDGMLLELHDLRRPWLATVRSRCMEGQGRPLGPDSGLQDQRSRLLSVHHQGKEEAEADGDAGRTSLPDANSPELTAPPSYDLTAGDIAGAVRTAAVLGQRRRVDVVAAAVSLLLEASNVAIPAAATEITTEGAATAESCAAGRRSIGAGRAVVAMEQQLPVAPAATRVGGGLSTLSPTAVGELAAGLDYFAPELETLAHRRTKAAVQLLQQRVGLPSAGNSE